MEGTMKGTVSSFFLELELPEFLLKLWNLELERVHFGMDELEHELVNNF